MYHPEGIQDEAGTQSCVESQARHKAKWGSRGHASEPFWSPSFRPMYLSPSPVFRACTGDGDISGTATFDRP